MERRVRIEQMKQSLETTPNHRKLCQKWIVHNSTEKWIQFPNRAHELLFSLSCQFFCSIVNIIFISAYNLFSCPKKILSELFKWEFQFGQYKKSIVFSYCKKRQRKSIFKKKISNCDEFDCDYSKNEPFILFLRAEMQHNILKQCSPCNKLFWFSIYIVYCSINNSGFNACYRSRMRISRYSL